MIYIPTAEEREACIQNEDEEEKRLFDPPLYKQRYLAVSEIINQYKAKTVLDMGCSEGQFLNHVKEQCDTVEEISGVDIDYDLLQRNTFRLKPKTFEFIIKRLTPLKMSLYQGSIGTFDRKFISIDVLACIEVIEHLYDDVLKLVPECLFGSMRPKVAVISTPNSEYNVLFKDFSGMRHTDHKFEWTRQQFKDWCQSIVDIYNYDVEYTGVGEPTDEREVGYCSQIAVFTHRAFRTKQNLEINTDSSVMKCIETVSSNYVSEACYNLVSEVIYPYEDINENRSEKIIHEIEYIVNHYFSNFSEEEEENNETIMTKEIPIDKLLTYPGFNKYDINKSDIVKIFLETEITRNLSLSDDKEHVIALIHKTQNDRDAFHDDLNEFKNNEFEYNEGNDNNGSCTVMDNLEEEEEWT